MMGDSKKIGLLIVSVAVLILAIVAILFLKKNNSQISEPTYTNISTSTLETSKIVTMPTSTPGNRPRNYQSYDISKEEPHQINDDDAARIARLFATRFGSFSNQSDYGNINDLKIFMTDSMSTWADKYIADLRSQEYTGEYYGIITHPLTTKILSYDEKGGKVKVEVTTERQESKGEVLGVAYRQKMTLDLVKINNEWLVDNAVWEK